MSTVNTGHNQAIFATVQGRERKENTAFIKSLRSFFVYRLGSDT